MPGGYLDNILRVDLSTGRITTEHPGLVYWRRNMGGWNVILDVLLKEVPAGADPLGPENKLVFACGILTGIPLSGVSRSAVGAKSPLTGAFGASEAGGFWGAEIKRAGLDAIIVEGQSPTPVYLWIKDGQAELRDASAIWGQETKETEAVIQAELGDRRVRCAMIGPGGENLVRYACVMHGTKDAAGRCGLGAVMGSKRLKAIAVHGTQPVPMHDPDKIREMARWMAEQVRTGEKAEGLHSVGTGRELEGMVLTGNLPTRNFRDGDFAYAEQISAEDIMEAVGVGMEGCWACAVRCKKIVKIDEPYVVDPAYGGPEYEALGSLGSDCGVGDVAALCKANAICNANSLDAISAGTTVAFAMECYENGLLTKEDTGGIDLSFGNGDALVKVMAKIARREGIGDLLAEGSLRAAESIGGDAVQYAMQSKGQEFPMHEPRFKRALAISYAVSPTGADHCHALHDSGLTKAEEDGTLADNTLKSLGILEPMALESLGPEKVLATIYNTLYLVADNCAPFCLFVGWSLAQKLEIIQATTGWTVSAVELMKMAERAWTLARVFNVREGFTPEDDKLPDRMYGPTTSGALADGGIDRQELQQALRTYYGMMGWDQETGAPTATKLHELGVGWAVEYLP